MSLLKITNENFSPSWRGIGGGHLTVIVAIFFSYCVTAQSQPDSSLFVGLKNGKVIYAQYSIDYNSKTFGSDYLTIDDNESYPLRDVKFYQNETGYHMRHSVGGFGGQEWFKREINGKVKTFTATQLTYSPGMWNNGMYTGGYSTARKITYYQKGEGVLKGMTYENLSMDLNDNRESMLKLDEMKRMKNAATLTYVGAGAILIAGLVHTSNMNQQEGPPPYEASLKLSPMLFVGAIGMAIPSLTKRNREEKLIQTTQFPLCRG